MEDCLVCRGHNVALNRYRKEINTLTKIVHQFGFIYKIFIHCNLKMCITTVVYCYACIISKQKILVSSVAIWGKSLI